VTSVRGFFGFSLLLYIVWCSATTLWSELPALSAAKALALAAVSVSFCSAGYWWAERVEPRQVFVVFWPLLIVVIAAGLLGPTTSSAYIDTGSMLLYKGLTTNPNLLGLLVCTVLPVVLWELHCRGQKLGRLLPLVTLAVLCALLLLSFSRASAISFVTICAFYLAGSAFVRRYGSIGLAALIALLVALAAKPDIAESVSRFIWKGSTAEEGVLSSREKAWSQSLIAARQGGFAGLGLGVTYGSEDFGGGLSAASYGREKGNSALALMEETGLIGLGFYLLLVGSIIGYVGRAALIAQDVHERALLFLILGTLAGFTLNSQFEAWWVSPGAPVTPYYWMMTGIGLALSRRTIAAHRGIPQPVPSFARPPHGYGAAGGQTE
jgi:O-antigen ligase